MIVVDTNILIYLWLPGPFMDSAKQALNQDNSWVSVPLWRSEFRNVAADFIRKNILPFDEALSIIRDAEEQMQGAEFSVSSDHVMQKVNQSLCTAYDCEFIALAEQLGCKLLSNDRQLLSNFPETVITLKEYLAA